MTPVALYNTKNPNAPSAKIAPNAIPLASRATNVAIDRLPSDDDAKHGTAGPCAACRWRRLASRRGDRGGGRHGCVGGAVHDPGDAPRPTGSHPPRRAGQD